MSVRRKCIVGGMMFYIQQYSHSFSWGIDKYNASKINSDNKLPLAVIRVGGLGINGHLFSPSPKCLLSSNCRNMPLRSLLVRKT